MNTTFFTRNVLHVLWPAAVRPIQQTTTIIIQHWSLCDNIRAECLVCNRNEYFFVAFRLRRISFFLGAKPTAEMRIFCAFCPFVCFARSPCLQMCATATTATTCFVHHISDNCVLHKYFPKAFRRTAAVICLTFRARSRISHFRHLNNDFIAEFYSN